MEKTAVFSCLGLGDGLITLILSNNLKRNGYDVTTFHPFLSVLQPLFPDLPINALPPIEKIEEMLAGFDRFFIFFEKSPWMQKVIEICESKYKDRTFILNPIATTNRDYPYWEVGKFDGKISFGDNLVNFCRTILKLSNVEKTNGIQIPSSWTKNKYVKRLVVHATSSRPGKNWPKEKFLLLAEELKKEESEPVFILTPEEKKEWPDLNAPNFPSLLETAAYIYESGCMIGNDSGIGHLASCLGVPTLIICRNYKNALFWRPCFTKTQIVHASIWIPNLKIFRLRDSFWKKWVSVRKVLKNLKTLSIS